jgi:hypothetical protein
VPYKITKWPTFAPPLWPHFAPPLTPYAKSLMAIPDMVAQDNIKTINMGLVLAPADFKAVYSVKAP